MQGSRKQLVSTSALFLRVMDKEAQAQQNEVTFA